MHGIKVAFTIPWFIVLLPLYFVVGVAVGLLQRLWVMSLSNDRKRKITLTYLISSSLIWPGLLVCQFRIKVLKQSEAEIKKLAGDYDIEEPTPVDLLQVAKKLRIGQKVKVVDHQGKIVEGKVARAYNQINCVELVVDNGQRNRHLRILSANKKVPNWVKQIEVLA